MVLRRLITLQYPAEMRRSTAWDALQISASGADLANAHEAAVEFTQSQMNLNELHGFANFRTALGFRSEHRQTRSSQRQTDVWEVELPTGAAFNAVLDAEALGGVDAVNGGLRFQSGGGYFHTLEFMEPLMGLKVFRLADQVPYDWHELRGAHSFSAAALGNDGVNALIEIGNPLVLAARAGDRSALSKLNKIYASLESFTFELGDYLLRTPSSHLSGIEDMTHTQLSLLFRDYLPSDTGCPRCPETELGRCVMRPSSA